MGECEVCGNRYDKAFDVVMLESGTPQRASANRS